MILYCVVFEADNFTFIMLTILVPVFKLDNVIRKSKVWKKSRKTLDKVWKCIFKIA